jgi:cytidylate kinase
MRITISGLPGSGTSTLAKNLAKKFNLTVVSAGDTFRKLAKQHNMSLEEFGCLAAENPDIDRKLDEEQQRIAQNRDNIILEGRLTGHLTTNADLKIWLKAPLEIRAERIAHREGKTTNQAMEEIQTREACEAQRYKKYYNIDINDLSIYDIILDTTKHTPQQTTEIISKLIHNHTR